MKISLKKEPGTSGVTYAMYFIAIITAAVIYAFLVFDANLYVAEEVLENGLHIVEGEILTANQSVVSGDFDRTDDFERELKRMKIVTTSVYQNTPTSDEIAQVNNLGKKFQTALIEQLGLVNNTNPGGGILQAMCGSNADILIAGDVIIYEPVYEITVKRTDNPDAEEELDDRYVSKDWNFDIEYEITGWIEYRLKYVDNVYDTFEKHISTTTPTLQNGNPVEGATIEASLGISFKGIKNIFANVAEDKLFSDTPEQMEYDVRVTQAVDIVITDKDSRKR